MKAMNKNLWQAVKFTLFSISAGIIQVLSFALLHDVLGLESYWMSHVPSLVLSVIWNFTFNRRYTFHSTGRQLTDLLKYILHMLVCYFIAYTVAPKLCAGLIEQLGLHAAGNVALTVGMVFFTVLNYFGQRYLVFRGSHKNAEDENAPRG